MSTIDAIIRIRTLQTLDKQARAYRPPTINPNIQQAFSNEYERRAMNAKSTGHKLSPDEHMKRQLDFAVTRKGLENYVGGRVHKVIGDPHSDKYDMSSTTRSVEQQGLQNKGGPMDAVGDNLSSILGLFGQGAQFPGWKEAIVNFMPWLKDQPWLNQKPATPVTPQRPVPL